MIIGLLPEYKQGLLADLLTFLSTLPRTTPST